VTGLKDWVPPSRRTGKLTESALFDGVPAHLWNPLAEWMGPIGSVDWSELALKVRVAWKPPEMILSTREEFAESFVEAVKKDPHAEDKLLDTVEGILVAMTDVVSQQPTVRDRKTMEQYRVGIASRLDRTLLLGGSLWTVDAKGAQLVERVQPAVREALEAALTASKSSSASDHLRAAWIAAYGRHPNPSDSYGEAIKAVEASAAQVVSPSNLRATLGTILGDLKSTPSKWEFSIYPGTLDPLIAVCQALWDGQTDRHGGVRPTKAIEPAAAQAAVMLSATAVHWFASGFIRRRKRSK
jgi:hypothetical protein